MKSVTKTHRVVFIVNNTEENAFKEESIEFDWYMGMNWQMRLKSSHSLHESILQIHPESRILEVSTKSDNYNLGKSLSAFNLTLNGIPIENIFQSSKVFSDGGPYIDLLQKTPTEAKKDPRISTITNNRHLISFRLNKKDYPIEPKSFFYDYIYILALSKNNYLSTEIMNYNIFTDIEFNQKTPYSEKRGPFNCQARSCAIFVWLKQNDLLKNYCKNPQTFIDIIYPKQKPNPKQPSLF